MYLEYFLSRINVVSCSLPTISGSLSTAVTLYQSLDEFIQKQRDNFEAKAEKIGTKCIKMKIEESVLENTFSMTYGEDLNVIKLEGEIDHFSLIAKSENLISATDRLEFMHNHKIESTFPNVELILRIYLTLPISNADGERSISISIY